MNEEFHQAVEHADVDAVTAFLRADPGLVNDRVEFEFTALHTAISWDELELARLLLANGADVRARNDVGIQPLHLAASSEAVELLLAAGSEINASADDGVTPVFCAATHPETLEVLKALLEHGADPNIPDRHGTTPLEAARQREDWDTVQLLEAHAT